MRRFLLLFLLVSTAQAQEIVTLPTRAGVTQSFFIANMSGRPPEAVALLFPANYIRLRLEDGKPRFGTGNFLPRSRGEFIRNGVLPVILDNPSDQQGDAGMTDAYRESEAHAIDVRAVVSDIKRRYPITPVFLVGTSRSTISMAHLARRIGGEVTGIVLSSSLWRQRSGPVLAAFDWSEAKAPLLFVHHRDDACEWTPFYEAERLGARFPLVSVRGGKSPESGPCYGLHAHQFYGKEPETVDAIAAWMLKKPYRKDID